MAKSAPASTFVFEAAPPSVITVRRYPSEKSLDTIDEECSQGVMDVTSALANVDLQYGDNRQPWSKANREESRCWFDGWCRRPLVYAAQ